MEQMLFSMGHHAVIIDKYHPCIVDLPKINDAWGVSIGKTFVCNVLCGTAWAMDVSDRGSIALLRILLDTTERFKPSSLKTDNEAVFRNKACAQRSPFAGA